MLTKTSPNYAKNTYFFASAASKRRIKSISKKIGSKDLFPAKVNLAKETLSGLKSLPI